MADEGRATKTTSQSRPRRSWRLPADREPERPDYAVVRRLILGSALMLFLELALIRWLGSNVVHLSYFTNFVLLGSFLGIGLGFLIARYTWSVLPATPVILAVLVIATFLFPVTIDRAGDQIIYFTSLSTTGPPAWLVLPLIFILVATVLAGPAEVVGRCFARLRPLTAYRWDLVGSLIGIGSFTLLSFLQAPSVVWGVLVTGAFVVLIGGWQRYLAAVAGAAMVVALLLETLTPGVSWSPYYKVQTKELTSAGVPLTDISVNGVPHQIMRAASQRLQEEPQYGLPYERTPGNPLRNVLIIGAGSGSDVAITLAKGAQHVDAVDIDPRIMQLGMEKHPDHPYDNPLVTRHVNDGRAYLEATDTKYDLILFALPDSLALVTGASQIRLESFLFTEQALTAAKEHLTPEGAFAMYNYYREDWLIDRLAGTAEAAFGHVPCVDLVGNGQAVVSAALDESKQSCGTPYSPAGLVVAPATDDRPFLYYQGGPIPPLYLWTLGGILLISVIAVRVLGGPFKEMRTYADLFFMGAAFMLLETKNIATFALLFGTTWLVNALVFAGVLVIVLAAVETTRRFRTPPLPVVFGGIAASLAVTYFVEPDWLLTLPFAPRLIVAILLAFVPIYLANVAFSKRFGASDDSRSAFGLNLLGAMLGGCLEYFALLTGYRNLLVMVAILYLLAFLLTPRTKGALVSV
ncbi:MAG TPA: spermidine synthase [Propionicimonas sp.]|nr:spermidine synthase [Propionicimonas sp.]HQA76927.1 spermidine synthase [Propionicimonas sp.]HQD96465.1 spermidine synthase [Propionicimonas sp.]